MDKIGASLFTLSVASLVEIPSVLNDVQKYQHLILNGNGRNNGHSKF